LNFFSKLIYLEQHSEEEEEVASPVIQQKTQVEKPPLPVTSPVIQQKTQVEKSSLAATSPVTEKSPSPITSPVTGKSPLPVTSPVTENKPSLPNRKAPPPQTTSPTVTKQQPDTKPIEKPPVVIGTKPVIPEKPILLENEYIQVEKPNSQVDKLAKLYEEESEEQETQVDELIGNKKILVTFLIFSNARAEKMGKISYS
jgi:hypothetical protein